MKKRLIIISIIFFTIIILMGFIDFTKDREEMLKEIDSQEEKIGPNARVIFKTYYTKCSHTKKREQENIKELVNLTKEELQEKFPEWKIEKFTKDEISLIKNEDDFCGEHYVLRNNNDYITVYSIDEAGNEEIYLLTEIFVLYLPETDQINLKSGIYVYSKEKLTEILQDFE